MRYEVALCAEVGDYSGPEPTTREVREVHAAPDRERVAWLVKALIDTGLPHGFWIEVRLRDNASV